MIFQMATWTHSVICKCYVKINRSIFTSFTHVIMGHFIKTNYSWFCARSVFSLKYSLLYIIAFIQTCYLYTLENAFNPKHARLFLVIITDVYVRSSGHSQWFYSALFYTCVIYSCTVALHLWVFLASMYVCILPKLILVVYIQYIIMINKMKQGHCMIVYKCIDWF